MLRYFLFGLFLSFTQRLHAQYPYLKHYTASDGLPSNTINDMLQDDDGFMWFATDAGVSRFDGHQFTNYRQADHIADDDVIRIGKDHEGRIWFLGFNGKASYYAGGMFYDESNSRIAAQAQLGSSFAKFMISKSGTVYLVSNSDGFVRIKGDSVKRFTKEILQKESGARFTSGYKGVKLDTAGSVWIFSKDSLYIIKEGAAKAQALSHKSFPDHLIDGYFLSDGTVVIPVNGKLFHHDGESIDSTGVIVKSWFGEYLSVEEDNRNNLWVLTKSGAHLYKEKRFADEFHTILLEAEYCGHVFTDSEGNTWLSPLRRGVYMMPSLEVQHLHTGIGLVNNNITTIANHPDGVIAGFSNGAVQVIQYKDRIIRLQPSVLAGSYIIDILPGSKGEFFILTNAHAITSTSNLLELQRSPTIWAKSYHLLSNDSMLIGGGFVLSLLSRNKLEPLYRFANENRIYAIVRQEEGTILMGTEKGLYLLSDTVISYLGEQFPMLCGRINDLKMDRRNRLWIASARNGLLLYKDNQLQQIIESSERISGRKILIDGEVVYAGTDKGIFVIREDHEGFHTTRIRKSNGLPSEKINALFVKDSLLWIGTDEGLEVFPMKRVVPALTSVPIRLTAFTVNGVSFIAEAVQHFEYSQNNIHLSYAGISFREAAAVNYRYRIRQEDTSWQYTANSSLDLPGLTPGRYKIIVQAATSGTNWSASPLQVSFTIHTPFWQTAWFTGIIILTAAGGLLLLFRYLYKEKLRKEKTKRRTVETELASLRSQMNPHFIFNSLNAIQDFIFQHKTDEANEYLTKFARLMRSILNQSRKQFASIEEEVELLKMYLELESLRFNHSFSWTMHYDKNILPAEMMIPSMLLQPVVENSIKHGFRNLPRKGILEISFSFEEGIICCELKDNGRGRQTIGKSNGDSHALIISKERLDILNKAIPQPCTMEVIDLYENGEAVGLKTIFRFPYSIGRS